MYIPTRIRHGAVASAGTACSTGTNGRKIMNNAATTTLCKPVRAPSAMPEQHSSTYNKARREHSLYRVSQTQIVSNNLEASLLFI